jgi:hypothetical protein
MLFSAKIGSCMPTPLRPRPRNRLKLKLLSSGRLGGVPSGRGRAGASSSVDPPSHHAFMHDSRRSPIRSCLPMALRPRLRNRLKLKLLSSGRLGGVPSGRGRVGPSSSFDHPSHPLSMLYSRSLSLFVLAGLVVDVSPHHQRNYNDDRTRREEDDEKTTRQRRLRSATTRDRLNNLLHHHSDGTKFTVLRPPKIQQIPVPPAPHRRVPRLLFWDSLCCPL